MRIKSIQIKNFRGFEEQEFQFDDELTVVVGNNASGKTSLLKALQVALGAYLKSLSDLPADKAFRCDFIKGDEFRRYNPHKKDFFKNEERTRLSVRAEVYRTVVEETGNFKTVPFPINWWRELRGNRTTHSVECAGELMNFVRNMEVERASDDIRVNAIYPLVLSFGVGRIDNQYRTASKIKKRTSRVAQAYKSALKETVDFQGAFDWLYRYERSFKRGNEFEGTREAFLNALLTAIPAMSEIEIDTKNNELSARLEVRGQAPVYQTYDYMSDGFKSVICIVAEMAHRCIELNGFLGVDAVKLTPGVVVIDELDLYLHPRWQQHILGDLRRAFPHIQFVVSSHSPYIIQSVYSRNVITLDGINDVTDPIKRSIEEISIKEMGLDTIRSASYNKMVEMAEYYYQLVKEGKEDEKKAKDIKKILDRIELQFSDDPAYVALLKAERRPL